MAIPRLQPCLVQTGKETTYRGRNFRRISGPDFEGANPRERLLHVPVLQDADLLEAYLCGQTCGERTSSLPEWPVPCCEMPLPELLSQLNGADLEGGDLAYADLRWSKLYTANLSAARLEY